MKIFTIAQYNVQPPEQFLSWVSSRQAAQIASESGNQAILGCLRELINMGRASSGMIIQKLFDTSFRTYIPYVLALRDAMTDPTIYQYIAQLEPIIQEFHNVEGDSDPRAIDSLMQLIESYTYINQENEYGAARMTQSEKIRMARVDMTSYLIDSFSTELSQAAMNIGDNELATLLESKAIARPQDFIENTNLGDFQVSDINTADKIVRTIWNSYGEEKHAEVYWYVKNAIWGSYFGGYGYQENLKQLLQYNKNMEELGNAGQLEQFMRENNPETSQLLFPPCLRILVVVIYRMLTHITEEKRSRYIP